MLLVVEQFLNGLQFGLLLFLLAAGLTLVFGIMDLVNLAHGSLYMMGAYFAATFVAWSGNFLIGIVLALGATLLLGIALEVIARLEQVPAAVEYAPQEAGAITGVLWRTKNQTPEGEYDASKMKIKIDGRGTSKLTGILTLDVLEKLPRHSYVVRLQCGAPNPRGTVKWTGVRFSDFAQAVGAQSFAHYVRLVGSDAYFIDEDMTTLMHPQVVLAWQLNDAPIPPQHGAPLRLVERHACSHRPRGRRRGGRRSRARAC